MKLRKNLGRLATAFVATAMLAAMALPVSAETFGNSGDPEKDWNTGVIDTQNGLSSLAFTKYLVTPDYVEAAPNVTFDFTLTGVAPATVDGKTEVAMSGEGQNQQSITVSSGEGHDTGLSATASFNDDNTTDVKGEVTELASAKGIKAYKTTVTFDDIDAEALNITQPGVYKYELNEAFDENTTANEDAYTLATDETNGKSYYVYLYAQRLDPESDTITVTGAELATATDDNTKGGKVNYLINYYMVDPTTHEPDPSTLTVNKTVTGNMGDKSESFEFTVTIQKGEGDRSYNYSVTGAELDPSKSDINNNKYVFKVKDSQSFVIKGLMPGDKYTVSETSVADEGYDAPSVAWAKGCITTNTTVENEDGSEELKNASTVTFSSEDGADSIVYTNNRDAVSPTGIVMNVAPYALLVVVAAGACFVFLRKRRED